MAAIMKCYFHTTRDALIRCKQCSKPICHDCRINTEMGIFCSEECYKKSKHFIELIVEYDKKKSSYWIFSGIIRKIVGLGIIIIVIWALWQFGPVPIVNFLDNIFDFITGLF